MKLLLFSDVHRDLDAARSLVERSDAVDLVVGAGDFASKHEGLEAVIDVLKAIETPTVVVPGNNETLEALTGACAGSRAAAVCHGSGTTVHGVSVFGLGGGVPPTPWDWSFDLTEDEARALLADCPPGGVLVSHSPPAGHLDDIDGAHAGSVAVLEAIAHRRPRLVVCGHIHACWGRTSRHGPTHLANPGPGGMLVDLP